MRIIHALHCNYELRRNKKRCPGRHQYLDVQYSTVQKNAFQTSRLLTS